MAAKLKNDDDAAVLSPDGVALERALGWTFNVLAVKAKFRLVAWAKDVAEFLIVINITALVRAHGADGKKASVANVDHHDLVTAIFRLDQKTDLRFEQGRRVRFAQAKCTIDLTGDYIRLSWAELRAATTGRNHYRSESKSQEIPP